MTRIVCKDGGKSIAAGLNPWMDGGNTQYMASEGRAFRRIKNINNMWTVWTVDKHCNY
ncbi:MAG: hypothetical protein IJP36_06275 [Bacteroides sp.]|nr:hypothetical protein [Bacteroides sp.]